MKKIINFYLMRHGHKDPESGANDVALLSKMGEEQIITSTRNNLIDLNFHGLYCSMKYRTLQTITLATSLFQRRNNGLGIEARIGFDYDGAPNLGEQFNRDKKKIEQMAEKQGVRVNIKMWHDTSPLMVEFLGKRLTNEIKSIAVEYYLKSKEEEINILVGSHEVVGELACLNEAATRPLREADIMKYVLHVEGDQEDIRAEIIFSEYIDRGF